MTSLGMMTSTLVKTSVANRPATNRQRTVVVAKQQVNAEDKVGGRRAIVLGVATAAVAAVSSIQRDVFAEEPKPGSPEAKKKYAPICVTMPTARVCKN